MMAPDAVFDSPVLKRAKLAVAKRQEFKQRPKLFVQLPLVRQLVVKLLVDPSLRHTVVWVLTAYAFLLR